MKNENDKPVIETIRKPYYQAQDGLWAISYAVSDTNDVELIKKYQAAHQALFEFEMELTKKYKWD